MKDLNLKDVITEEQEHLRLRRQKLQTNPNTENWFGIALSGGGIRSATINLGFLRTLNRYGIIKKADYLSTVSGGGYTHSYIQGTLKEDGDYEKLFSAEHTDAMRQHGEYMTPGLGIWKNINAFVLIIAFLVSWAMSLLSPLLVGIIGYLIYLCGVGVGIMNPVPRLGDAKQLEIYQSLGYTVGILMAVHFVVNISMNFNLSVSKIFNKIEAVIATVAAFIFVFVLIGGLEFSRTVELDEVPRYLILAGILVLLGYLINPNALSFHRFYRKQLADLFLRFSGNHSNIPLKDLFNAKSDDPKDFTAPYPLINTCLNLQAPTGDAKFKGSKASDYFLLSPLYCGSKLTAYVPTAAYWDYRRMTLPAAVTISAAAVNPGMGIYSNPILSALMTIFNARLGFWISNPLVLKKSWAIVWWPWYFFKELFGRIGTSNKMVNISDGGHIENLGVYELLRRECRLIVAFDAGEDKKYTFFDLNNLLIRARNELGYEIRFRPGQQPEEVIFPRPSSVYSKQRFAIADIYQHWVDEKTVDEVTGEVKSNIVNFDKPKKTGTFIYVKSSVTAPQGKPFLSDKEDPLKYGTYKYKIYHPDFPHESTSDQFFDPIQWESYYQLGQYIGADILGLLHPDEQVGDLSVDQLINWFDYETPLFHPVIDDTVFESATADEEELEVIPTARTVATPDAGATYRM